MFDRSIPGRLLALPLLIALAGPAAAQTNVSGGAEAVPPLDDATIVAIFDAANTADIESGALAAEKGSSREVREYGAMLARDHEAVRKLGRDLAAKLEVTPTPPADDASARAHAAAMKSLRSKSGAAFDRAFLEHEIAFHQAVIDAINSTLLPTIDNAEVKALVVKVAPAFEAHKVRAQQILSGMESGAAAGN